MAKEDQCVTTDKAGVAGPGRYNDTSDGRTYPKKGPSQSVNLGSMGWNPQKGPMPKEA